MTNTIEATGEPNEKAPAPARRAKAENHRMPLKDTWGTPAVVIEAVRLHMGGIDLDPCSDAVFNTIVQAGTFYDREMDGLSLPWFGRVWLNPPGGSARLTMRFWNRLIEAYQKGEIEQACYLSFSLDSLQNTQGEKSAAAILDFPTIIFARRLRFLAMNTLAEQKQPWKPCALTWLPPKQEPWQTDMQRGADIDQEFAALAATVGAMGEPGRIVR